MTTTTLPIACASLRTNCRLAVFYTALTVAAVGCFLAIRAAGEGLPAATAIVEIAPPGGSSVRPAPPATALPRVLLALAAVIVAGQALALVLRRIGQPPVIGEVLAGILLGPSLFVPLGFDTSPLLPPGVAPYLAVIAQLGVILYMFLVGLEFNAELVKAHAQAAIAISHASMIVPFLLGTGLSLGLFTQFAPAGTPFTSFALFMGVALSVTAFPVLARILTDRGEAKTPLGVLALSCAAVGDVTAWCVLALVSGVVTSQTSNALVVTGLCLLYLAVMLLVVRPLVVRLVADCDRRPLSSAGVGLVLVGLLLSALATEAIGIHAIFGAFLLGVLIPANSRTAQSLHASLEKVAVVLLLPAFFAYTGMRMQIGLVQGASGWLACGAIILVASLGKFGGTLAAARVSGLGWRASSALGILMNTRGLMELIVLNVGLDLGVISPELFAMLVVMAIATTFATSPLLSWLCRTSAAAPETALAAR